MNKTTETPGLVAKARKLAPSLGFGLFAISLPFLPPQLSYVGGLLFAEGAQNITAIGAIAAIAAGIICGLASLRQSINRPQPEKAASTLCLIGYPCATASLFASSLLGDAAAAICGGVSSSIASCLALPLAIAWLRMLTDLSLRQAAQSLCVSIALASALNALAIAHLLPYSPAIGIAFSIAAVIGPLIAHKAQDCEAEKNFKEGATDTSTDTSTASSVLPSNLLTRSMLPTVVAMCFGLFLAVFSMTGRLCAYVQGLMPTLYFNIDAISPFAAAVALFAFFQIRKRIDLAEIAYFFIPFCSVFFFVATTFAAESPLFNLGFAGSTALLMTIGLLALAALPGIAQAGEIPAGLICSTAIAGCALASFFGIELPSAVPVQELGPFLLFVATIYFVAIISIALVHQRRLVDELEECEASHNASMQAMPRDSVLESIALTFGLTEREREVLDYVAAGHNSPYIAERLFISEYTVRTHMRNIYRKTGVESKEGLVRFIEDYQLP